VVVEIGPVVLDLGPLVVEVGSVEVEVGSAVVVVVLGSAAPARRREGLASRHHPGEMDGTEPWVRSIRLG
jgi:hypothetical protein